MICLGIAGGSGSGKSWLANYVEKRLGRSVVTVCQDWYYHDRSDLTEEEVQKVNVDHPKAIESSLMAKDLKRLLAGRPIQPPVYDYATHARTGKRDLRPADLVIAEGLHVLHERSLRALLDCSVFVDYPSDLRLSRRVRRDSVERRIDLSETLRLYEHCVRPMHEKFIQPSSVHATWIWKQEQDSSFPEDLLKSLRRKL